MHATKEQLESLIQIKKRSDFLKIQSGGKKWVSHGLIIQTAPNLDLEDDQSKRIGFTVTKRVSKSAVVRNRIKRRLRAVAADILPDHAKSAQDYILVGRPQTLTRGYEALRNDLRWCLKKLDLLDEGVDQ